MPLVGLCSPYRISIIKLRLCLIHIMQCLSLATGFEMSNTLRPKMYYIFIFCIQQGDKTCKGFSCRQGTPGMPCPSRPLEGAITEYQFSTIHIKSKWDVNVSRLHASMCFNVPRTVIMQHTVLVATGPCERDHFPKNNLLTWHCEECHHYRTWIFIENNFSRNWL